MPLPPIDLRDVALGTGGFVLRGHDAGDGAGTSLADIGDINGDGFEDFAIGAPFAYSEVLGFADHGETFVVFGNGTHPSGAIELSAIAAGTGGFVVRGAGELDNSGIAVAGAGDFNGDGFADFVVGARGASGTDNLRASSGEAYLVFGKATSFGAALNLSAIVAGTGGFAILGGTTGDQLGSSIAAAGDLNGDGLADIVIGAPLADGLDQSLTDGGNAYVIYGRTGTAGTAIDLAALTAEQGFAIGAAYSSDRAGTSVSGTGDINGDGIADMVIGAKYADVGGITNTGRSFVVYGGGSGPVDLAQVGLGTGGFAIEGTFEDDMSGRTVSTGGDFNGDGYADILIGAYLGDGPADSRQNAGEAYLVFGAPAFPPQILLENVGGAGFAIFGEEGFDNAARSVAFAGDLNGDGYDDLAIGAYRSWGADNLRPQSGDIYIVFGSPTAVANIDLATIAAGTGGFVIRGEDAYENAHVVSAAGDIDGDGFDDLLIGVPRGDGTANNLPSAGDAYIVYGADFTGAVTHQGGPGSDPFAGTDGADRIVGGTGDDFIDTLGGADVVYGGQGDDSFLVPGADILVPGVGFRRIDGGTGTDTLVFYGAGDVLDLADHAGSTLRGIEIVQIFGSSINTVQAGIAAVAKMSGTSNTLRIDANLDDSIDLVGDPWVQGATEDGYTTFTAGAVTLVVTAGITILPCFATGTHIATARGEVRVEDLREGDIAVLDDGRRRPVRWIGHRTVQIARHPRPWDVQPIRIRADAFSPGRPYRDLRLSPDHAVFAHGQLVPVRHLVNGATIAQEHVGEITYWHVELAAPDGTAAHDILLAEGLPCESFLDTGNRSAFADGGPATQLHPDFALRVWEAEACAPLLRDGPALADLRTELQAEATALGWEITTDPDLRLLVDGRPVWPQLQDGRYVVRLPAGARTARLRSRTTTPAWLRADSDDTRILGVAVTRLLLDGMPIALAHPHLSSGWHGPESGLRWTDGDAVLPLAGARRLDVSLAPLERYWRPPAPSRLAAARPRV